MTFNYQGKFGFDISTYQDSPLVVGHVDFLRMRNYGASFVIIRAGQGNFIDQDWEIHKKNSRGILPRGPYWFFDPLFSPMSQALLCLQALGRERFEGRVWLDLEFTWGGNYAAPAHWRTFLNAIKMAGLRTGIYTRKSWWDDNSQGETFQDEPLWVAQYNSALTLIPAGFGEPMMWQDGTPAIGHEAGVESLEIDHNRWNSNYDFSIEWGGDSPPNGGTMPKYYRWNADAANIRKGPATSYAVIGYLVKNDVIQVDEPFVGNWAHFVNAQHADGSVVTLKDGTKAVDNPDCWCTTAYLVEVAGLPNPPPVDPPPPPVTTLPVLPYTITLGDDVTYEKVTITGSLNPKI